jgi:hypothetical protein
LKSGKCYLYGGSMGWGVDTLGHEH